MLYGPNIEMTNSVVEWRHFTQSQ